MARAGRTLKAAAVAALLLVLVTMSAATVDAAAEMTGAAAGRRGLRRARPTGLTQCVAGCGTTVTSCLLDCYGPSGGAGSGDRSLLPICLLDCTNNAMFCATDCSTQALN